MNNNENMNLNNGQIGNQNNDQVTIINNNHVPRMGHQPTTAEIEEAFGIESKEKRNCITINNYDKGMILSKLPTKK